MNFVSFVHIHTYEHASVNEYVHIDESQDPR